VRDNDAESARKTNQCQLIIDRRVISLVRMSMNLPRKNFIPLVALPIEFEDRFTVDDYEQSLWA
jgi:hypothetical protein